MLNRRIWAFKGLSSLSSAEASLGSREAEKRAKYSAQGTMGRGKKGRLGLLSLPIKHRALTVFFFKLIYTSFTFEYPAEVSAEERGLSLFWSNYSKKFQLPTTSFVFLRLSGEPEKMRQRTVFVLTVCTVKSRNTKKKMYAFVAGAPVCSCTTCSEVYK